MFIISTASLESVDFFFLGLFFLLTCGAVFLGLEFLLFEDFNFLFFNILRLLNIKNEMKTWTYVV